MEKIQTHYTNVWQVQTESLCYWSLNFTMDYIINVHTIWLARQSQILTPLTVVLFSIKGKATPPTPQLTYSRNPQLHARRHIRTEFPVFLFKSLLLQHRKDKI